MACCIVKMFPSITVIHIFTVSYCFVISVLNYVYSFQLEHKIKGYRKTSQRQNSGRLSYSNNLKLLQRNPFPVISSSFSTGKRSHKLFAPGLPTIAQETFVITKLNDRSDDLCSAGLVDETCVFVLIPARNEAKNIVRCLESLVKQKPSVNGFNFSLKILVMDDDSTDGTFELASSVASLYPNQVYVFRSHNSIPDDWYGKSYTLHRLYHIAVTCFLKSSSTSSKGNKSSLDLSIHHLTSKKDDSIRHPTQLANSDMSLPSSVCTGLTPNLEDIAFKVSEGHSNVTRSSKQYKSDDGNVIEMERTYFLLTDADTVHEPDSVLRSLEYIRYFNVHFISGFPRQILGTWGEVITVPIMFVVRMFIPFMLLNQMPYSWSTFAIGQYMMISESAFATVNGMEGVKKQVCEDLALAKLTRSTGFGTKFIPIRNHVSCRMYRSFSEGFYGISKTLYPALRSNILMTLTSVIFSILSFFSLLPLIESFWIGESNNLYCNLIPNFVIILSWCLVLCSEGLPFYFALFWPISCLNSFVMGLYSFSAITCFNGILWKERRVK